MEFSIKKFTIDKYNCKKKKEEIINNDQSIELVKSINYDNNNRALSWNEVYRIYQDKSYIKTIFKNSITSSAITQQSSNSTISTKNRIWQAYSFRFFKNITYTTNTLSNISCTQILLSRNSLLITVKYSFVICDSFSRSFIPRGHHQMTHASVIL